MTEFAIFLGGVLVGSIVVLLMNRFGMIRGDFVIIDKDGEACIKIHITQKELDKVNEANRIVLDRNIDSRL